MHAVLSHIQALRLWLSMPADQVRQVLDQAPVLLPRERLSVSRHDAMSLSANQGLHLPLHVLVPDASQRRNAVWIKAHYSLAAAELADFYRLSEGLYICSPRLAFLQVASDPRLSDLELIWISHLLCGTWTPAENDWGQEERPALMEPDRCRQLCALRINGAARAAKALALTCGNIASAGEAALALSLVLPHKLGDLHVVSPREVIANPSISITGKNGGTRRPDLLIPSIGLGLEYQGGKAHFGKEACVSDAGRQIELAASNIETLPITMKQLLDDQAMDRIAHIIAKRMGRKYRPRHRVFFERRHHLQQFLYAHMLDPLSCCSSQHVTRKEKEAPEPPEPDPVPYFDELVAE